MWIDVSVDKKLIYQQVIHTLWITLLLAGNSIFIVFPLFSTLNYTLIHNTIYQHIHNLQDRKDVSWNQWS